MSKKQTRSRRQYLQTISVAGITGVAGCTGDDTDGSTGDESNTNRSSDTDSEGETTEGYRVDQSGDGQLTIGHLSTEANPLGVGSVRAAEMAVHEINNNGGVQGEDVELVTGDTAATPTEAERLVEALIREDNANVIVGGFLPEVAKAVLDLTADFAIPYVSTGLSVPGPGPSTGFGTPDYEDYKHYFRIGSINPALQAEAMRDYLVYLSDRHGWNSLAFYRDQATWTEVFGSVLPGLLEDEGLSIEAEQALSIRNPDLSPVISTAQEENVDYVLRFFGHIGASPQQIFPQWRGDLEFGLEGIHIPGTHPEYDIPNRGRNIYETTGQHGAGGATPLTDNTQPFIERYIQQYAGSEFEVSTPDGSPMQMGFGTYDAILLLQQVCNEIGTPAPDEHLNDYVDAMLSTQPGDIDSVSGPIEFYGPEAEFPHDLRAVRDQNDRITNFPVTQFQPYNGGNVSTVEYGAVDRPGQVECVYPERHRTADHQQPSWMS